MKFTKDEKERLKQIIITCNIQHIKQEEILNKIYAELHVSISRQYLHRLRNKIRKDAGQWIDSLTRGKYDYIAEFKQRIDELYDISRQRHEMLERDDIKPFLRNTILTELRNDTLAITDLYQSTPIISGLKLKINKLDELQNKVHELEQENMILESEKEDHSNALRDQKNEIPR